MGAGRNDQGVGSSTATKALSSAGEMVLDSGEFNDVALQEMHNEVAQERQARQGPVGSGAWPWEPGTSTAHRWRPAPCSPSP